MIFNVTMDKTMNSFVLLIFDIEVVICSNLVNQYTFHAMREFKILLWNNKLNLNFA